MMPGDSCKPVPSTQKGLKNHFLWLSNLDFIPRSMFPIFKFLLFSNRNICVQIKHFPEAQCTKARQECGYRGKLEQG